MWTITRLSFEIDCPKHLRDFTLVLAGTLRQLRDVDLERNVHPWLNIWDRVVITRPDGTIHSVII